MDNPLLLDHLVTKKVRVTLPIYGAPPKSRPLLPLMAMWLLELLDPVFGELRFKRLLSSSSC